MTSRAESNIIFAQLEQAGLYQQQLGGTIPGTIPVDDDHDGIPNLQEDLDGNGDLTNDDTDQDGLPNYLDADDDGDTILTSGEDLNHNGNPLDDDGDGDGIPDCLQPNDTIAGLVWRDQNGDGIRQLSDPFIPGTTVSLFYHSLDPVSASALPAEPVLTATTTITGWYHFAGLVGGSYYLTFTPPGQMLPTFVDQEPTDRLDNDAARVMDTFTSRTMSIPLGYRGREMRFDAGFVTPGHIDLYVYHDLSDDGRRQLGEPLVAGAVVTLTNADGQEVGHTATGNDGSFRFAYLLPGRYEFTVLPPEGFHPNWGERTLTIDLSPATVIRYEIPLKTQPQAITLVHFRATPVAEEITLAWETSAEIDTVGYYLYLSASTMWADALRLNGAMIGTKGATGGRYAYDMPYNPLYDPPLTELNFWIVEIERSGRMNRYGPFPVAAADHLLFLPLVRHEHVMQ
ncbi:MAG: SdrD B-like domain-containing protein [Caldilineaceae bacterium]